MNSLDGSKRGVFQTTWYESWYALDHLNHDMHIIWTKWGYDSNYVQFVIRIILSKGISIFTCVWFELDITHDSNQIPKHSYLYILVCDSSYAYKNDKITIPWKWQ